MVDTCGGSLSIVVFVSAHWTSLDEDMGIVQGAHIQTTQAWLKLVLAQGNTVAMILVTALTFHEEISALNLERSPPSMSPATQVLIKAGGRSSKHTT